CSFLAVAPSGLTHPPPRPANRTIVVAVRFILPPNGLPQRPAAGRRSERDFPRPGRVREDFGRRTTRTLHKPGTTVRPGRGTAQATQEGPEEKTRGFTTENTESTEQTRQRRGVPLVPKFYL